MAREPLMAWNEAALEDIAAYAQSQKTTGLLVIQDRAVVLERNWPLPPGSEAFLARMTHGVTAEEHLHPTGSRLAKKTSSAS